MSVTYRITGQTLPVSGAVTSALARLVDMGLAEYGTLYAAGSALDDVGAVVSVAFGESADTPQEEHGNDSIVRLADVYLVTTTVPAAEARLVIADGKHAGTWSVLGIERRDACGCLVRVRMTTRRSTRAPLAREVLR